MPDYVNMDACPFRRGDRVKCVHTHVEATVLEVADANVFCVDDHGCHFYRTWTHELDTLFHKAGGGLTRLTQH